MADNQGIENLNQLFSLYFFLANSSIAVFNLKWFPVRPIIFNEIFLNRELLEFLISSRRSRKVILGFSGHSKGQ